MQSKGIFIYLHLNELLFLLCVKKTLQMLHVISPFQIIRQKNSLQKEVKHSKCFTCFELIQYTLPLTLVCPSRTYSSGDNIHFSCFALAGSISSNKSWLDSLTFLKLVCLFRNFLTMVDYQVKSLYKQRLTCQKRQGMERNGL